MIQYGPWLAKFATSMTWRALVYHREHRDLLHGVIKDWSVAYPAECAWRKCLLGQIPNPGVFEQHMVRFDHVFESTDPVPRNLNRYLMRSFDFDLMSNGEEAIIYVKISGFMFFGLINYKHRRQWRGTKIGYSGGVIGGDIVVPAFVLEDIIRVKAASAAEVHSSLSDKQRRRIKDAVTDQPDRWVRSATLEAVEADLRLSGANNPPSA